MTKVRTHSDIYLGFNPQRSDFRNENLSELVLSYAKGQSLLDIGCGYGYLLQKAAARGLRVAGVEPDEKLVALGKHLYPVLRIHHSNAEDFKSTEHFDTIVCVDILECMPDYLPTLRSLAAQVKSGARLVLVVPAIPYLFGSRDRMMGYYRRFGRNQLLKELQQLGLRIEQTRYWNLILLLPYFFIYKLLQRESHYEGLRGHGQPGLLKRLSAGLLQHWFRQVENRLNFGLGLTLLIVAERP